MKVLSILTCMLLASIAQAKLYSKFSKPKLRYVQNSYNREYKPLLPEERRKLALFPKNPMRYVISLEPVIEISRPYLEKKKPVMKKLIVKDKKEIDAINEINQSKDEEILEVDVVQTPIVEVDVIKEVSVEIIEDEPEESEFQNDASVEQDEPSEIIGSEAPIDISDNENIVQLEDVILPLQTNLEGSEENKSGEVLPDVQESIQNSISENEVDDANENDNVNEENNASEEQTDKVESEGPADNSDNANIVQLEDIILTPKDKLEGTVENKNNENPPDIQVINNILGGNEVDDAIDNGNVSIVNDESQNIASEEQTELSNIVESEASVDNSDNENIVQLKDIILPPKDKLEGTIENKNNENSPDIQVINNILGGNEVDDAIIDSGNVSNVNDEFQNIASEKKTELSNIVESETSADNSDHENIVQLGNIILPPKTKLEGSAENKSNEVSPDVQEINNSLSKNDEDDVTEKDNISNENNESQNNDSEKQSALSDIVKSEAIVDNGDDKNTVNLLDIILPPRTELGTSIGNKSGEVLSDDEVADINDKSIENVNNKEPEEFVTTETYDYEEPVIYRRKRGTNIIEEENMASTVAGFKFTGRDRRLNNHLAYKNINS